MKITPVEGIHIELAKRQGAPFRLESSCPKCGQASVVDLSRGDHLSYPTTGKSTEVFFYCQNETCETEWQHHVIVEITIREAP